MTTLTVDEDALQANMRHVTERMAPAAVMLVVKDDAYSLGIHRVIPAAIRSGIAWIGAFTVATAERVRAAGWDGPVFCWLTSGSADIDRGIEFGVDVGVGDAAYLELVASRARAAGQRVRVHLKVDTGLHRNGVRVEDWPAFVARAAELREHVDVRGVWSHIAEASDADDDASRAAFDGAVRVAESAGLDIVHRHLAASAAAWHRPEFRYTMTRIGAFCYGIRSADGPDIPGLVCAATLKAVVQAVADDAVTLDVGTLDGLPVALAGRMPVGTPAGPRDVLEIGQSTTRVEPWPGAQPGDRVAVFGPGTSGECTPTDLAERIGTVGEEVLIRLGSLADRPTA